MDALVFLGQVTRVDGGIGLWGVWANARPSTAAPAVGRRDLLALSMCSYLNVFVAAFIEEERNVIFLIGILSFSSS